MAAPKTLHQTPAAEVTEPEDGEWSGDWLWDLDNVVLRTVGVDIGSSTSHLTFSRVLLQRQSRELSSRYIMVAREVVWRSGVLLTPYTPADLIDADRLETFMADAYAAAGLSPADVDSGAVILTGEALKRDNARVIADLFAERSGRFVCATAGHHLEAVFAAHGSGAVSDSREGGGCILNVDIGGGTTKFAIVDAGRVVATAAIEIGGRLLVQEAGRITRIEEPLRRLAGVLGYDLRIGDDIPNDVVGVVVEALVDALAAAIEGRWSASLLPELLVTPPLPDEAPTPSAIRFSGGVAEYLQGRAGDDLGDLGSAIARVLGEAAASGRLPVPWDIAPDSIRATVTGCSQFSVQVSGNTVRLGGAERLPLHNLAAVAVPLDLSGRIDPDVVAAGVRSALGRLPGDETPFALGICWAGPPEYGRLSALATGIARGVQDRLRPGGSLVVILDADLGRGLGLLLEPHVPSDVGVMCLDGLALRELDYVDIGEIIQPAGVVPVVIKSLLFAAGNGASMSREG